ncbi:MAG TPA: hypothetical protein VGU66_08080 [Candidatus Elarobacter sp.]|nr:hypothetical protein [Candidatus Elarobacter sp.]
MPIEANAYRRAWAAWLPAALPLLENEEYAAAFKSFPSPELAALPFRPAPARAERRIALITTAGAYDAQTQAPFAAGSAIGDVTHRVFPTELPDARIALRHGHYDPAAANADVEVLLPRRTLRDAGAVLTANVISTMGYCIDWPSFIEQTVPQLVAQVRADRATCALLVPV